MFPRQTCAYFEDFLGYNYNSNLWFITATGTGGVGTTQTGTDAYGGQMRITCTNGGAGTANIRTVASEWWTAYTPTFECLFRIQQTTDIEARMGFYIDGSNWVALEADDDNSGNFIFVANRATVRTEVDTGIALTTGFRHLQIKLNGFTGDALCILDEDAANVFTIPHANIPAGDAYQLFGETIADATGAGTSRLFWDYVGAYQQRVQG